MNKLFLLFTFCFLAAAVNAQKATAAKPVFDDPVYHGAASLVIIYNKQKKNGGCCIPTAGHLYRIQQYNGCMAQGSALQKVKTVGVEIC